MSNSETWPGKRIGLPQAGAGSLAGFWRRLAAITFDWLTAYLVATALFRDTSNPLATVDPWLITLVFLVAQIASIGVLDGSPGHLVFGMRVLRLDGRNRVGFVKAMTRSLLLCLLIPAVIWDADGRGMHDKAAGTALVMFR